MVARTGTKRARNAVVGQCVFIRQAYDPGVSVIFPNGVHGTDGRIYVDIPLSSLFSSEIEIMALMSMAQTV
jgi:hypothetical protein